MSLSAFHVVVSASTVSWELNYLIGSGGIHGLDLVVTTPQNLGRILASLPSGDAVLLLHTATSPHGIVVFTAPEAVIMERWTTPDLPPVASVAEGILFGRVQHVTEHLAAGAPRIRYIPSVYAARDEGGPPPMFQRSLGNTLEGLLGSGVPITYFGTPDALEGFWAASFPGLPSPLYHAMKRVRDLDEPLAKRAEELHDRRLLEELGAEIAGTNPAWVAGMCAVLARARGLAAWSPTILEAALRVLRTAQSPIASASAAQYQRRLFTLHDEVALTSFYQGRHELAMEHQLAAVRLAHSASETDVARLKGNMTFYTNGLLSSSSVVHAAGAVNTHIVIAHRNGDMGPVMDRCAQLFPGGHVFVYTLGGTEGGQESAGVLAPLSQPYARPGICVSACHVPDVGGAGYVYLRHVVTWFDALPDSLVFMPDTVLSDPAQRRSLETVASESSACFPDALSIPGPLIRAFEVAGTDASATTAEEAESGASVAESQLDQQHALLRVVDVGSAVSVPMSPASSRPFGAWAAQVLGVDVHGWCAHTNGVFRTGRFEIRRQTLPFLRRLLAELSEHPNPEAAHFMNRAWFFLFCGGAQNTVKFTVSADGVEVERHQGIETRIDHMTQMVHEARRLLMAQEELARSGGPEDGSDGGNVLGGGGREGLQPPPQAPAPPLPVGWRSVFQVFAGDFFCVDHRPFGPVNRAWTVGCPPHHTEEFGAPCFAFSGWDAMDPRPYDAIVKDIREAGEVVPIHDRVFWSGSVACVQARKRCREIINTAAPPGWFYFNDTDRDAGETDLHAVAATRTNGFIPMADQVRENSVLLDINGNGYPARRKFFVHSGRPLIIPDADLVDWPAHHLQPWEHYVPGGKLGEGIIEGARWCREHPVEAAAMAAKTREWARVHCTHAAAVERYRHIILSSMDGCIGPSASSSPPITGHVKKEDESPM